MLRTRKTSDEADAISANVLADDVAESQRVGMNQFFPKPIKIGQLTTLLQNWCAEAPGGADEPAAKRPCHG